MLACNFKSCKETYSLSHAIGVWEVLKSPSRGGQAIKGRATNFCVGGGSLPL